MAWNRPKEREQGIGNREQGARKSPFRGLVAGAIVVLGAAVAAWWLWSEDDDAAVSSKPTYREGLIKEVTPAPAPKAKPAPVAKEMSDKAFPEKWDDSFVTNHKLRLHFSKMIEARTNMSGLVTERYRLPNGQTWRIVRDPPPPFDNQCDNAIAMVVSAGAGAPIPPVPGLDDVNLDKKFAKSMASPIEILDSDSPGRAALKLAVKNAKAEILKMIKEGDNRSVGEILQDYITENNHILNMQGDALRAAEKIRRESGDEQADLYLEKVNEKLVEYGIEPVKRPDGSRGREGE